MTHWSQTSSFAVTDTFGGLGPISERATGDYVTVIGYATATDKIKVDITKTGVAAA
ncbi:MAG: hypothetical protein NT031_20565 [Planctomycetota bacterium]|nr:hypothetical protein [Planctomycetota bacterium]